MKKKNKTVIIIGLFLSSLVIAVAAWDVIVICDKKNQDYNSYICRPHLDNELVIYSFFLNYTLLFALVFISFLIIKYKITSILKKIILKVINPDSREKSKPHFIVNLEEYQSKDKTYKVKVEKQNKSNEQNKSTIKPSSYKKIISLYVLLSIVITLPTAFILLQYTSSQFFEAIGISSYTKWFLTEDSKNIALSNVFFTYLDNVAFVILGVGSLWVFLIRQVNRNQNDKNKFIGASKLQSYLFITIILTLAGVAIYAIDSYKTIEEKVLSETILNEETIQTSDNIETTTTIKIKTSKIIETNDDDEAWKQLKNKLSLELYESDDQNNVPLRLDATILFLVVVSGLAGLFVSLFEIYVINKIE